MIQITAATAKGTARKLTLEKDVIGLGELHSSTHHGIGML